MMRPSNGEAVNDIETLVQASSPHTTPRESSSALTHAVSEEARVAVQSTRRRRHSRWIAGAAATALVLGGATAATAALRSVWWDAPNSVNVEMTPFVLTTSPVKKVSCILQADYAPGVDASSAEAQEAFRLGQAWLADHPIILPVADSALTLTPEEELAALKSRDDEGTADSKAFALQIALEFKATQSAWTAIDEDGLDTARAEELAAYLSGEGIDPTLLVIESGTGLCDVIR